MGIQVVDMHLADVSVPADPLIAGQTNGEFNKSMRMGVYSALSPPVASRSTCS